MNEMGPRRTLPDQSSGSGHTLATLRHPYITDPISSKRVCFYKSGDPQFNGLRMVINNRTFKTFDALLDSLSKKVPLPFGVRNITTPRGVHAVRTLDELEDGKSYICSDRRKVKPINLVLASKKLPPWYHARPTSARRRAVQLAKQYPGRATRKREPAVVVRTPKRIMVFRNGDPSMRHTVMLQRKTTPTFESLLDYVSQLMQFHVVKLYTPDGRRVDGLPALILCSDCVVAAGREPFKSANYNVQKSPAPTWLPTNRKGPKRLKRTKSKKKSLSGISKSSHFSPSSERYFVNQIHNSIAGSLYDLPSDPTGSVELETGHRLESVAETEGDTCLEDGAQGQDGCLPADDDIEKSFRVNQDGSMTVEMRVRLTIKEEETVSWTTTLTRSSVANRLDTACLPDPEPVLEQENSPPESDPLASQDSTVSVDTADRKHSKDDKDPPSMDHGIPSESGNEEDNVKSQTDAVSPLRAPTPGPRAFRKKQASVESIRTVTDEEIQEGTVGSYSYIEQTENGAVIQESCMVKHSSTRPVPKPRRVSSVDVNNRNNINQSTFKSAGVAEILQIEDSQEEAVLHIYEQETCQDSFLANGHYCAQGASMYGFLYGQPATSDTARLSSSNDFETEIGRPSTASESISIWRPDNVSLNSDLTNLSLRTGVSSPPASKNRATSVWKQPFPKPADERDSLGLLSESSKENSKPRAVNKPKKVSSRPKVIRRYVRWTVSPGKRLKESKAGSPESHKKAMIFSSAAFLRRIYGNKPKSVKSTNKRKRKQPKNGGEGVNTESSDLPSDTLQCVIKDPNILSPVRENKSTKVSFQKNMLDVSPADVSQPRGVLRRQKSMHQEREGERDDYNVNENMSLPALNSSSSVINEYVEHWLEKSHSNPTAYPDGEAQKVEAATQVGTEEGISEVSDVNGGVIVAAGEPGCLEAQMHIPIGPTFENIPLPDSLLEEMQSNESFVNKQISPSPSMEKTLSIIQTTTEILSANQAENIQTPVKISVEKIPPSHSLSIEKAPLPVESPVEKTELTNTEHCVLDVSSVASSPLYRFSSASSLVSEDRPASISPTSDQAPSPADHTSEKTNIPSTLTETSLSRNPSVKRARLVSNLSFERKMSIRKASLVENTISSTPIEIAVENTSLSSNRKQLSTENPLENTPNSFLDLASQASSPSYCMSASPTSLTSEERAFSASPSSDEAPSQTNISSSKESKIIITPSHISNQKEAASPKSPLKKTRLISNLSLEKKLSIRRASSEKSEFPNDPPLEKTQVSSSPSVGRNPLQRKQSLKSASSRNPSPDKTPSPNLATRKIVAPNSSPTTERLPLPRKTDLRKRLSPYSQSLEAVSPPMKLKSKKKLLSKNLSLDNTSEPAPSDRKGCQATPSKSKAIPPASSLDKTIPCDTPIPLNDETKGNQTDHKDDATAAQEKSLIETQIIPQPLKLAAQPDIKPVLEKLCYSIKSIRQITQNKRPSCLEKSNSLPDFSCHVASTFGSSSKALLAFLSVMTLKGGITSLNMHELSANNVSCAEALRMIDSLREIASIEDADKLKASLSDLQQSTSAQLLQSWKGFQELKDKCKSRSPTPNPSEQEVVFEAGSAEDCGIEENAIDELINELDMPENLKEELAALPVSKRSDSDEEGEMATRITEQAELSPEEEVNVNLLLPLKGEAVGVSELIHDDKVKVDVKSMIERFTKINKPKTSNESSLPLTVEKERCKQQYLSDDHNGVHMEQSAREKDWEYEQDGLEEVNKAKSLRNPIDHNVKQISGEEQLQNAISLGPNDDKEIDDGTQSSREVEDEEGEVEEEEQECHIVDKPSREKPDNTESMSILEGDFDSDEAEKNKPSADKYEEQRASCEKSISTPGVEKQSGLEEEQLEVDCKDLQNEDSFSDHESHPNTEEEDEKPSTDNCMGINVSTEESISSPDVEEQSSSEEEQREAKSLDLQTISEESSSNPEEDQNGLEEEQEDYTEDQQGHEEKMREELQASSEEREDSPEGDKISFEDNEHYADNLACTETHICGDQTSQNKFQHTVTDRQSSLTDNQDIYVRQENSCLIKQSSTLEEHYSFDVDEDSGNDHSSYEEHADEVEQAKVEDEQCSSVEDQLSFEERQSSSEEEQASVELEESYAEYQESHGKGSPMEEHTNCETVMEQPRCRSVEQIEQSVAERISLLQKQVAGAQQKNLIESSGTRQLAQNDVPSVSDAEDPTPGRDTSYSPLSTSSVPPSSLSFSYDSSGVITKEPEGYRVKSIKEMFLAKSVVDIQYGKRQFPNTSELSDYTPQILDSGGYQTQTSSELSSGEDDSARKSLTKGFVRRTIERLNGKKDAIVKEPETQRPPSAPKAKKKESSSIFPPFHISRSKVTCDLSYFNAANTTETYSEPTRCIAFNAHIRPGDSVPIDEGRWLLKENTLIRKSISDPAGINKSLDKSLRHEGMFEDTKEDVPYSLFSTNSERGEDKVKAAKCTYFSLPHAKSESDMCQDDLSTVSKNSFEEPIVERNEESEETKTWAERNGKLPSIIPTDFKMLDNKVHPLVEGPPGGSQVVVVQPQKGHGVVSRRHQEPDALDMLYTFCGQHCPIL